MINALKQKSKNNAIRYKFGVHVPHNVEEACRLDAENGNTLWADAMALEIDQIDEYKVY